MKLRQWLIHACMKSLYPNKEDRAMAHICEGMRQLEISEVGKAETVQRLIIEPEEGGYHVEWQ